ncbi:MAG: hypothetical protein IID34_03700 [Planctomycetes bacterium]|nr:hypothetical protein [Planctomycetota bacterium]
MNEVSGLGRVLVPYGVNYLTAASLLSLAPVALLFVFAQRFITRGMILSGLRQ